MPEPVKKTKISDAHLRHRNTQRAEMRPGPAPEECALYKERGDMCGVHDGSRSREEIEALKESILKRQSEIEQNVVVTHQVMGEAKPAPTAQEL